MFGEKMDVPNNFNWKETVTTMTGKVFPGLSHKIDESIIGNEIMSNLPLQMALYFNVIFVPVWCLIIVLYLFDQFKSFNELYKFITLVIIITIMCLEMLRLYLGYEGNLRDKVPELAGFWMLSILLQFPLQTFFLLNPYFKLRVTEVVMQSIMWLLLGAQLLSGYSALKYTAKKQALYVRIMNLDSHVSANFRKNKYKLK